MPRRLIRRRVPQGLLCAIADFACDLRRTRIGGQRQSRTLPQDLHGVAALAHQLILIAAHFDNGLRNRRTLLLGILPFVIHERLAESLGEVDHVLRCFDGRLVSGKGGVDGPRRGFQVGQHAG